MMVYLYETQKANIKEAPFQISGRPGQVGQVYK